MARSNKQLNRRTFIRGAGGVALGLPLLEAMSPVGLRANAAGAGEKRYVFMYGGVSIAAQYAIDEGLGMLVPGQTGASYATPHALAPLDDFGIKDKASIVSNLLIPEGDSMTAPPAGRTIEFHGNTKVCQIAGSRSYNRQRTPTFPSSDQLAGSAVNPDPLPAGMFRQLVYRAQADVYAAGASNSAKIGLSYRSDDDGDIVNVPATDSPQLAWRSLWSQYTEDPQLAADLTRRRSVLDRVNEEAGRLRSRLGTADRERLDLHLAELEALEKRLGAELDAGCQVPVDPGDDPPTGSAHPEEGDSMAPSATSGYSDEDLRAEVMCDMVSSAFACDLARTAAVRLSYDQSFINLHPLYGHTRVMHGAGHSGDAVAAANTVLWHVKHFARLASSLEARVDPATGQSLLDTTVIVLLFEGGVGQGEGSFPTTHSTENMVALTAGGGALGLAQGRHFAGAQAHPGQVVLSCLRALGHEESLGEVAEPFDPLLG